MIGRRLHGYVALYRYVAEIDTVFVLVIRTRREGQVSGAVKQNRDVQSRFDQQELFFGLCQFDVQSICNPKGADHACHCSNSRYHINLRTSPEARR